MASPAAVGRYSTLSRIIALLAGLACVIIGFVIVLSNRPPIADHLVGWGFVSAGFGLIALAVPI